MPLGLEARSGFAALKAIPHDGDRLREIAAHGERAIEKRG
jgi:hypothetical protein